jgi:HAD superfamily phosphatase (TIGR01668 family)
MGKGLKPDYYLSSLFAVTAGDLLDKGIKGLLLDIDNTLVANHEPDADGRVISFISGMQEGGVRLAILSNATAQRISLFNRPLGLPVVEGAFKPFRRCYRSGILLLGLEASEICMAGDQLFTDILGANRSGIRSMLVAPMHLSEPWYVRLKRLAEKAFIGRRTPSDRLSDEPR